MRFRHRGRDRYLDTGGRADGEDGHPSPGCARASRPRLPVRRRSSWGGASACVRRRELGLSHRNPAPRTGEGGAKTPLRGGVPPQADLPGAKGLPSAPPCPSPSHGSQRRGTRARLDALGRRLGRGGMQQPGHVLQIGESTPGCGRSLPTTRHRYALQFCALRAVGPTFRTSPT